MPVTKEQFEQAVADSRQLTQKPDNDTLLKLYSLFKQAGSGDAPSTSDAGMFDFAGKAKWEAWDSLRGKTRESAMEEYVQAIASLKA